MTHHHCPARSPRKRILKSRLSLSQQSGLVIAPLDFRMSEQYSPLPAAHTREELAKVSSLVLTARRLVAGGALVDLSALEERVRLICEAVQQMPLDEGRSLLDELRALIGRLDSLAADLEDRLGQLARLPGGEA
jgi:hypothetical protein